VTVFFNLFPSSRFSQIIRPSLTETWRSRSFSPCHDLCRELVSVATAFLQRYSRDGDESFLAQVAAGIPFHRKLWPVLVGEVLLYGAAELAPVEADVDTLCRLLAGGPWSEGLPREQFAPIHQVLFGARDLVFGGKFYRPHHAGWNDPADVARLAQYLGSTDPETWTADSLEGHLTVTDPADRVEEIELARECFPELRELYERAHRNDCVIVREVL
jgi:hypothetical protein